MTSEEHQSWSEDQEEELARPPHVVKRFSNRGSAEMMRHVLAEEDVPAVVERDHRQGGWSVLVAEAAAEDAERALENREAMATSIDWEDFDPGKASPRDARLLASASTRRRLTRGLLTFSTILVLGMVLVGFLTMLLELLPSSGSSPGIEDREPAIPSREAPK